MFTKRSKNWNALVPIYFVRFFFLFYFHSHRFFVSFYINATYVRTLFFCLRIWIMFTCTVCVFVCVWLCVQYEVECDFRINYKNEVFFLCFFFSIHLPTKLLWCSSIEKETKFVDWCQSCSYFLLSTYFQSNLIFYYINKIRKRKKNAFMLL